MANFVRFIADHAAWFYLACAVGIIIFLNMLFRAQRSATQSLFGLELELATDRQKRALRLVLLTFLFALVVLLITTVIEPNLPASQRAEPTPTRDIFATPPATYSTQTPTATVTLTATLTVPTATPQLALPAAGEPTSEEPVSEPPPLPTRSPGTICVISSPPDGSQINGEVTFLGSATTEQFLFYKLEAYGPQTSGVWASLLGDVVSTPVVDNVLGTANFGGWEPGGYSIRLVIVDTTSNEVVGCYLGLTIASP